VDFFEMRKQHFGNAAAQDHYVGFKQIDDVAEPHCEELDSFQQKFAREGVAVARSGRDNFAANRLWITASQFQKFCAGLRRRRDSFARAASYSRAGRQSLNAPLLPAIAHRTAIVDADVATFRSRTGAPVENSSVEHDARANSCTDASVKDVP